MLTSTDLFRSTQPGPPRHFTRAATALAALLLVASGCSSDAPAPQGNAANKSSAAVDSSVTGDSSSTIDSLPVQRPVTLGERPEFLRSLLPDGELKRDLATCELDAIRPQMFSISHRGAPLRLPEHSREGYLAAVDQGAGIVECDVTFTADGAPVCRHSQCDLHTTTNILDTDLAAACSSPPALGTDRPFRNVQCCTSDITLARFRTLRAKRDGSDPEARTLDAYLAGTPGWRNDPDDDYATIMTLPGFITLLDPFGVAMTPELKVFDPPVDSEVDFSRATLSRTMFDAFRTAGVPPERLYPQSFELDDLRHWQTHETDYAGQAVWLDGRYRNAEFNIDDPSSWQPDFAELQQGGVSYLAPPIWMLLTLDDNGEIAPSRYATEAAATGLSLLTWSLERGVDLERNGGFYYQSIASTFNTEGDQLRALDVLARDVGVDGVFSDWPATTTFYAHCRGEGK